MHTLLSISPAALNYREGRCECGMIFHSGSDQGIVRYHRLHAIGRAPSLCDGELHPFQIAADYLTGEALNPKPHELV